MKDIILLYEDCCIYEIVILNYFLKATNSRMQFCSVNGQTIKAMEGYSVNCDSSLEELDPSNIRSFTIPGGDIRNVNYEKVLPFIKKMNERKVLISAICAGVDLLEEAGILKDVASTHSQGTDSRSDCVRSGNIITATANAYVDFAIEVGRALELSEDEADLQETIEFWKYHKRVQ